MKIAILAYSMDDNSGTSLAAIDNTALFSKLGHNVTLFTLIPSDNENNLAVKSLPKPLLNLPLWKYPLMYFFAILPAPLHLPFIKRCLKPLAEYDAVFAYDYPLGWFGYYLKKQNPSMRYLCFFQGLQLPEMCEFWFEKLYVKLLVKYHYKTSVKNADNVIVESRFLKDYMKNNLSIESKVIPNPTYLFMDRSATGENVRNKYKLNNDPVILYVDRLEEHKGIELLLDAFSEVRTKVCDAKLIIIGKCTLKYYQKRLLERNDEAVIFIDYVPHEEIADYYTASDVFATCALCEEGLSHTIIEAQAFGKPVVAFDIPAHREIVKNGETGILVNDVGNKDDFAAALTELLTDISTKNTIGENALLWAEGLGNKAVNDFTGLLDNKKE
ncbi:MAG TPA: hypothetical protein DCR71_05335 [Dehalococcoidia bacterium]|nr:hypothetical protein [Dehalococcoidia bacterium]